MLFNAANSHAEIFNAVYYFLALLAGFFFFAAFCVCRSVSAWTTAAGGGATALAFGMGLVAFLAVVLVTGLFVVLVTTGA